MMIATLVLAAALSDQQKTTTAWIPRDPAKECSGVKDPKLCADLLAITDRDQIVRHKWLANRDDKSLQDEVKEVDTTNLVQIEAILKEHGWPSKALVGEKAAGAAWTVIQHSDLEVQKRYIAVMTKAADTGELHWGLLATTIDRICVGEGKPQVYGTQFKEVNGEMVPEPIEDAEHVDQRRAKVGLQPLAEYAEMIKQFYKPKPAEKKR